MLSFLSPLLCDICFRFAQLFDCNTGQRKYLGLRHALGLVNSDLALPMSFDDKGRQNFDSLRAGDPVSAPLLISA